MVELSSDAGKLELLECGQRPLAHLRMALLAVSRRLLQLRQQVEGDVGGLVIRRIGAGDVRAQRSQRGLARKRAYRFAERLTSRRAARDEPRRNRFHVAFHSRNLPREKNIRRGPEPQRLREQRGTVYIRVAMHLAIAQKLGMLETRNHAQDPLLVAEAHVILESHQVVAART